MSLFRFTDNLSSDTNTFVFEPTNPFLAKRPTLSTRETGTGAAVLQDAGARYDALELAPAFGTAPVLLALSPPLA